jgi:peptide/nickel transport system ATP-binding protein
MSPLLEVEGLTVALERTGDRIIEDVHFSVEEGEVVGLVGETGSGKTTTGVALLGYVRRGGVITAGTVTVDGQTIVPVPKGGLRDLRGKLVAYIPQDPSAALNPALRLHTLLEETLQTHGIGASKPERQERIERLMGEVKLPSDDDFLSRFPHQLSGGQQQRVCIAIAMACEPRVLILDEPTTGLDVTTQAHVLVTLTELVQKHRTAAVYVTHDLAVVANIAHRVMVMYAGKVVEEADRHMLFGDPGHPYTAGLIRAIPDIQGRRLLELIPGRAPDPTNRPDGCSFAPRCAFAVDECRAAQPPVVELGPRHYARCVRTSDFRRRSTDADQPHARSDRGERDIILSGHGISAQFGDNQVLYSVSFELARGECLAVVGESGSGKTTLSRAIVGLAPTTDGHVEYEREQLPRQTRDYPDRARREIQYIFQSPYTSLNPRRTIRAILATPLVHFTGAKGRDAEQRIIAALERVSLSSRVMDLVPDQLSGGERQRVAIARALVCEPKVLLCDEITSALDVSVQASIVRLLADLQKNEHLSLLFVTHNMGLVRSIADRVMVLEKGRLVEANEVDTLLDAPQEDYTKALVADTPTIAAAETGAATPTLAESR